MNLKELYEKETGKKWNFFSQTGEHCTLTYMEWLEQKAETVENLKCCGNCSHMNDGFECGYELPMTRSGNCCDKWQSDQLTRSEREIK